MTKASSSGIRLTSKDAAIAKGMIVRGDRQHDIAAYFGVNGGRIAEISTGAKFASVAAAPANQLPPKGPYIYSTLSKGLKNQLADIQSALQAGDLKNAQSLIIEAMGKL